MKLTLKREALADLTADELRGVAGAASGSCPLTDCLPQFDMSGNTCPVGRCLSYMLSCNCTG